MDTHIHALAVTVVIMKSHIYGPSHWLNSLSPHGTLTENPFNAADFDIIDQTTTPCEILLVKHSLRWGGPIN